LGTVGFYKSQFNRKLSPIKLVLMKKKEQLTFEDWLGFVERTKESILNNPSEYLGAELPSADVIKITMEIIFKEFTSRALMHFSAPKHHFSKGE
jgi:hypothetical protein